MCLLSVVREYYSYGKYILKLTETANTVDHIFAACSAINSLKKQKNVLKIATDVFTILVGAGGGGGRKIIK